jgi:hypothetical protein
MDFIEWLPTSVHANCIMVVVDKFSKFAHFIPLHHPFTAPKVAQAFLDNVLRLHGLPTHIISDRDPIFTSVFWRELFHLAQVTLSMSSAYHPQSNGQTEHVNQCLETYLRCFFTPARVAGSGGFLSPNTGITPMNILLRANLRSRCSMAAPLVSLKYLMIVSSTADVDGMLAERATMLAVFH